jgi:hypothetical protein
MRRVWMIVVCTLLFQAVTPSQSYAWWDGFEHLSGPGPFFGWDIQLRLFCVSEKTVEGVTRVQGEVNTFSGVLLSVCRVGGKRRAAFDLGTRFLWTTKPNDNFAHGKRISLTTIEPAVSIPLLSKYGDRWDILDYGFGAGLYWFSSEDFPSFRGTFLEPLRLDVRLPLKNEIVKAVYGRYGLLVFPGGFEPTAFNATNPQRISRDWVNSIGIYADLTGIFK